MPPFCYLLGGYTGVDLTRNVPSYPPNYPPNYQTVLDGQTARTMVEFDRGYHCSGVDGFKLCHGSAYKGGAVQAYYCGPVITSNWFTGNQASAEGGGIFGNWDIGLTAQYNLFTDNVISGGHGGAIALERCWDATIDGNTFAGNETSPGVPSNVGGGAVSIWGTGATISGNTFTGNVAHATHGGALLVRAGDQHVLPGTLEVIIIGNTFGGFGSGDGNTVEAGTTPTNQSGGAVCIMPGCDYPQTVSARIERNTFIGNSAPDFGGALSLENVTGGATVVNNLFYQNHADGASGIKGGGAILVDNTDAVLANNTFVENHVGTGTWPSSYSPAAYGGAIHAYGSSSSAKVINNLFLDNRALPAYGNSVAFTSSATGTVTYCDAFLAAAFSWDSADHGGWADHYLGVTPTDCFNPGIDPEFCDVPDALWPTAYSLLHTGQGNDYDADVPLKDINDNSRSTTSPDMGAYESDYYTCP